MKIGILTSSRADFGIYLPLLREFKSQDIDFDIIAFGTHLSYFHGYTINEINECGFDVAYQIETLVLGDTQESIATAIGLTVLKFSSFWAQHHNDFDVVLCLGDRFEMFAGVSAGIPFNIDFAHLHGGEKTLGAIDNIFRHAITHASKIHFTSTKEYADRVENLLDGSGFVYHVGALSLDNLDTISLFTNEEFVGKWGIDLSKPTILTTFHPETVSPELNKYSAYEIVEAIKTLSSYQIVITMPNADTAGNGIREIFQNQLSDLSNVFLIENFGKKGYFTIMKKCSFLIGNTSSGIIEAASFGKYVINLGERQKGRVCGENVLQVPISTLDILSAVSKIENSKELDTNNIYYKYGASKQIINILKKYYND